MSKQNEKDKWKLVLVAVLVTLIIGGFSVAAFLDGRDSGALAQKSTRRTCEFLEVDGSTFAFCNDGSEFRVVDAVTPTPFPKGQ